MKRLRLHHEVAAEIEEAYRFYDLRDDGLAERLAEEISRVRSLIEEHPRMYQRTGAKYRRAPLDVFPFAIVYREYQTESIMFALAHYSRKPNYWRRRTRS
jgi:ParE toxin of type II toxin-antitoxin system, parDE